MNEFFALDGEIKGSDYELFGWEHIAWLWAMALLLVMLVLLYRRAGEKKRRRMEIAIAMTTLALNLFRAGVLIVKGEYGVGYLPLHLCAMSVYIEAVYAIFPNKYTGELLYAVCMPGALAAMLAPNWLDYQFWNFMHLTCFGIHMLLVIYPLMLVFGGRIKPSAKHLPFCFGFLAAVCVPVYFLNRAWGTNFMFLMRPAEGSPLMWFEAVFGNPGYLVGFPILAAVLWTALYLPIYIVNQKRIDRTSCAEVKADDGEAL